MKIKLMNVKHGDVITMQVNDKDEVKTFTGKVIAFLNHFPFPQTTTVFLDSHPTDPITANSKMEVERSK